jgi:thiosulfate reductase cytochrome b subunit
MLQVSVERPETLGVGPHARWVRVSHAVAALSVLTLAFTGFVILMAHPRLYWGDAGNDLIPPLLELPISRNYQHGGFENATAFAPDGAGPITANRTYDIFNQNGWGRSLHFLAAWALVLPGVVYVFIGIANGHFRSHVWPAVRELNARALWRDVIGHVGRSTAAARGGPQYGVLQKCAYSVVVFVAAPLIVLTGLTMAPAVTAAFPFLLIVFGGYQSARTIHFFTFAALVLFVFVHVVMVIRSGFVGQVRSITTGG